MLTDPAVVDPAAKLGTAGAPAPEVKFEYVSKTDPGPPAMVVTVLELFMVPRVTLKIYSSKVYNASLGQYPLRGEDAAVVITGVPAIPMLIALDGALEQEPSLSTTV